MRDFTFYATGLPLPTITGCYSCRKQLLAERSADHRNKALKGLTILCAKSIGQKRVPHAHVPEIPVKLTNLKITPKLGILVGVTLLGLCVAGVLAGYLMKREMLNARIEQTRAVVDMARNMALGLQRQVEAGQMTKEAAIAEFSKRGNTLTFDKGNGYVF